MYQEFYFNREACPPPGWTRHQARYSPEIFDKTPELESPVYFYKHETDPQMEFWFPIPIGDQSNGSVTQHPGSLLLCHTQRAWLRITDGYKDLEHVQLIESDEGEWAGVVFCYQEPRSKTVSGEQKSGGAGDRSEFAVISLSEIPVRPEDIRDMDGPIQWGSLYGFWGLGNHEIYSILWIEWQGGIAYRRALGQVRNAVWDRQKIDDCELILG